MNLLDGHANDRLRVLYVDDEEMARKYFVRACSTEFDVHAADGVDAALLMLDAAGEGGGAGFDVLVTDYRMPLRVGGELLRHVERHHPHIVRILVTAYADKQVLLDTGNGGEIFRVLEKPLDLETVRSTLHLAGQRARERGQRRATLTAIEEALAFLAHQLNTPLATIAQFADGIVRRGPGGAADDQPAAAARTGADAATPLVSAAAGIHDHARYCQAVLAGFVDSARRAGVQGDAGTRSARQMVLALLAQYPLTPAQRGIISLDVRGDFPVAVLANCVALVLSSLLSNALRAVDGHPAPALVFTVQAEPAPQIQLSDNGSGIPPAILARLLQDPITMHGDGEQRGASGWGLIFCNRIMQSFGGGIGVESEHGRRTTATLTFPALIKEHHDRP
jgi:two-component system response regulator PhcR